MSYRVHKTGDDAENNTALVPRAEIIIVLFTSRYGGIALGNTYGPGTGRIWLDDVVCFNHETDLGSCRHRLWGSNNCQHSNDVSIACQRRNYCTCGSRLWIASYIETVTNNLYRFIKSPPLFFTCSHLNEPLCWSCC